MRGDADRGKRLLGRSPQGLTLSSIRAGKEAVSRLKSGEVTERKQVGDAESMMNEEVTAGKAEEGFTDRW